MGIAFGSPTAPLMMRHRHYACVDVIVKVEAEDSRSISADNPRSLEQGAGATPKRAHLLVHRILVSYGAYATDETDLIAALSCCVRSRCDVGFDQRFCALLGSDGAIRVNAPRLACCAGVLLT
jgi:hypothetical protein